MLAVEGRTLTGRGFHPAGATAPGFPSARWRAALSPTRSMLVV